MRRVETYIRMAELGLALTSTYMTAVSLLQTSLYVKFKPLILSLLSRGEALLGVMRVDLAYFDLTILILVMALSLLLWRRGGEVGFGRLFSLNMLMFFPCVLDFSMFNWINLILPYEPAPSLPPLQVFSVGLLLQATYVALRNTVRFRDVRRELEGRGAEAEDLDAVSRGQMAYLALLIAGTAAVVASIYYATPLVKGLITLEAEGLPYPHVVIGLVCSVLIAVATIIYLRGNEPRTGSESESKSPEKAGTVGSMISQT